MLGKKKMGAHGVVKQVGVSSKSSESRLGAKLRTNPTPSVGSDGCRAAGCS